MPENMQPYMTPGFFVTFWQLSLYDVLIPMERYQTEVDRLNGIVRELDATIRAAVVPSFPGQPVDKAAEAEAKRARDRCMQTIQALNTELKAHTEAYEATRKRLSAEKAHWFSKCCHNFNLQVAERLMML
jgi:THO complex subunit 2